MRLEKVANKGRRLIGKPVDVSSRIPVLFWNKYLDFGHLGFYRPGNFYAMLCDCDNGCSWQGIVV
jgi:hypothetical protein